MAPTFHAPATQRLYDVCVLGSQLGGLVAGALLARRGFRVLHVAHEDPGPRYADHGYALPFGPSLLPAPRHLPPVDTVLAELGLATDLGRVLSPSEPDLQLLLPRHRLELSHDPSSLRAELQREWPREAAALESALSRLGALFDAAGRFLRAAPPIPSAGLLDRLAVRKALKLAAEGGGDGAQAAPFAGLEDHDLVLGLGFAHRLLGALDGTPSPLSRVRLLGAALRGTGRLPDGIATLREMIRRKIAESHGELRGTPGEPAVAESVEIERRRIAALRLAGSPDAHVARAFVVAMDAGRLLPLLPPDVRASRAAAALRRIRPSRRLLSVNLVVRREAIPPGLGGSALSMRDSRGGDSHENAVFLQVLPALREAGRGPASRAAEEATDARLVCASGFVDAASGADALRAAAGRIREAALEAIPFLDRHVLAESTPLLVDASRAQAAEIHALHFAEAPDRLGLGALPPRSPWKNLFFAGREVAPGLGLEGEFHAGVQAAGHVAAILRKKDPLRRSRAVAGG